ncbi:MAG: hypothetical protein HKO62_09510 [Gammaproteobacteria bacterium]|nr:hypothetical protein [Gammaproteobacteria bacterium]NNM00974.1 hypothetical protein [Gammaproteobacteria bacterium]
MAISPTKTRAMMLLRQALDAGAGAEAMQILDGDATRADADSSINWPAAVMELETLLRGSTAQERRGILKGIEVSEEDVPDFDFPEKVA